MKRFNLDFNNKKIEKVNEDLYILNYLIKSNFFHKWIIFIKNKKLTV